MTRTDILNAGLAALTALVMTLAATQASAQRQSVSSCGPRSSVLERLTSHYGETRRGMGVATQNRVVEVFASDASGSWTITVTLPDGRTCLVASGQNWEERMDDLSFLSDVDA